MKSKQKHIKTQKNNQTADATLRLDRTITKPNEFRN